VREEMQELRNDLKAAKLAKKPGESYYVLKTKQSQQ
jgi:hypothetical protein